MEALVNSLRAFAEALAAHPDFELIVFTTYPGVKPEVIAARETAFFEELLEPDFDTGSETPPLRAHTYCMPYDTPEARRRLVLPKVTPLLHPTLREFYSVTDGLQLLWHYRGLQGSKVTAEPLRRHVQKGTFDWGRTHTIDHHWSIGSIMIPPLKRMLAVGVLEGNFTWSEKGKRDTYYPVVPFDWYDDWATTGLLLRGELYHYTVRGEDAMASFTDDQTLMPVPDYLLGLGRHRGSILLRTRPTESPLTGTDWSLDALAAEIRRWEAERGSW